MMPTPEVPTLPSGLLQSQEACVSVVCRCPALISAPVACLISASVSRSQALTAEAVPPPVPLATRLLGSDGELQDNTAIPAIIVTATIRYIGYGVDRV